MTDKTKESVFNCRFISPIALPIARLRLFFSVSFTGVRMAEAGIFLRSWLSI